MEKRKTLAIRSSVLAVAAAFCAVPHVHAAQPVEAESTVQLYGHLDMSIDDANKGLSNYSAAVGKLGWQADISSNLSRIGVRGSRDLGEGLKAVFQIETQVDVSSNPGGSTVPDNTVKGAFASRNSFLGLAGGFGSFKVGKSDAPYKLSTGRMDPFSATVGDYNSIIGNTGGENRAEFDTRLNHAMWYDSPNMGAFSFSALYAPGQNRSTDNSAAASGEPDCTGGNQPTCNDGSFGDAISIAGRFNSGPLYAIAAYEVHKKVNRTGDEAGTVPAGAVGVVDETGEKIGAQYKLSNTTLNAIYERLTRNAPVADFNERQHNAYWLALTQKLTEKDDFNLGWAHAGKTPGGPGSATMKDGTLAVGAGLDDEANMYAIGYKHHWDKQTTWYAVYAQQSNHAAAHYDLGASGHGITTDCHDSNPLGASCFSGAKLQAVSVGITYNF